MDNKTHLGLFPLRIFLFPGEQTTLHLFEPRYLQLSTDCINNNECFGIPYQGKTTLSELGSLVKIVQILKKYENGEMDILIECTNNFKINHFENKKNTQAYFIQSNEIKYHNKDFEEINSNLLEIQHIGTIDKNSLVMTHNKGLRKYNCSYLSSKKQILIELSKFL